MRVRPYGGLIVAGALAATVACDTARRDATEEQPGPASTSAATTEQRSDAGITMSIQARYFDSNDVKARDIDITTNDGVVTLRGSVDNDAERQQAERIAKGVDGVIRVDNQLAVAPNAEAVARDEGNAPTSPPWITTKIQAQYFMNPALKPWNINVTTSREGVVTLQGRVDSPEHRAEAVRIARNTDGVTRVEDMLRGEPEATATTGAGASDRLGRAGDAVEDAWITTKIQSKFFMDPDVKGRSIDVDTANGVVTLRGTVGSGTEKTHAVSVARSTDGVREVHENLMVESAEAPASRDDRASPSSDRRSAGQRIDDAWITMNVQSKFFLHDVIKARDISVDTRSGVVTLTGTVPNDAVRSAAERIARETDGVTRVVDNLKVG